MTKNVPKYKNLNFVVGGAGGREGGGDEGEGEPRPTIPDFLLQQPRGAERLQKDQLRRGTPGKSPGRYSLLCNLILEAL